MRRVLISPENSFLRNVAGLLLVVPLFIFAIIVKILVLPFDRPQKVSAIQVALYLHEFIEGLGGEWDWDDFTSVPIADPQLESIRARASQVILPIDDVGLATLGSLLSEVENLLGQKDQRGESTTERLQYIHLAPDALPKAPILHEPFSAVVIIAAEVTPEWRHEVSKWLVNSGCLCMMAWGDDCSLWDDSVDVANLEAHNWEDIPDDRSVVTTWHEKESLSDVFWYANYSTFHPPEVPLEHLIILDITGKSRELTMKKLFARACDKVE
jgi:hypothetical protein